MVGVQATCNQNATVAEQRRGQSSALGCHRPSRGDCSARWVV
jgi:hypothetical protein